MITILDEWLTVSNWWTPFPKRTNFVEVIWNGRELMFTRTSNDKVWRIVSATRTETTPAESSIKAE